MIEVVKPDWSVPDNVVAFTTTRTGGCSQAQWLGLNLATHVDDNTEHVLENRRRLGETQCLPGRPNWLNQVHGIDIAHLDNLSGAGVVTADAAVTQSSHEICAVLTADCLPVFFCDTTGSAVAVAHAGWRGLAAGVLEATVEAFPAPAQNIIAAFGPSIGVDSYEVGPEVVQALNLSTDLNLGLNAGDSVVARQSHDQLTAGESVKPSRRAGHAYIDLGVIAATRLASLGVRVEQPVSPCTFADSSRWYSHRRDGNTGRMASIIYVT